MTTTTWFRSTILGLGHEILPGTTQCPLLHTERPNIGTEFSIPDITSPFYPSIHLSTDLTMPVLQKQTLFVTKSPQPIITTITQPNATEICKPKDDESSHPPGCLVPHPQHIPPHRPGRPLASNSQQQQCLFALTIIVRVSNDSEIFQIMCHIFSTNLPPLRFLDLKTVLE